MTRLIIWILWLFALLLISHKLSPNNLLTPSIGFFAGFFVQAVYAVFYVDDWSLNFSDMTMWVLFSGTATFFIVSQLTQVFFSKSHFIVQGGPVYRSRTRRNIANTPKINIERWKLLVLLAFQLFVIAWTLQCLSKIGGASLGQNIYRYRMAMRSGNNVEIVAFPVILRLMRTFCASSSYIFGYILAHGFIYKYRQHRILLISNYFLGIICSLTSGARGTAVTILFATLVQAYFIHGRATNWKRKLPLKTTMIAIVIVLVIVFTFQMVGNVIGRNNDNNFNEYLSVYLSAELKNLDIFVREGNFGSDITTCYTIADAVSLAGNVLGIPSWVHKYYNPFRFVNGHSLGNVSTTFYANVHDGGIPAVILFSAIMAFLSQIAYLRCRKVKKQLIDFSILVYPYIFYTLLFSFFSNKFYELVFHSIFIQTCLCWWALRFFLTKVNFMSGPLGGSRK